MIHLASREWFRRVALRSKKPVGPRWLNDERGSPGFDFIPEPGIHGDGPRAHVIFDASLGYNDCARSHVFPLKIESFNDARGSEAARR